MSVLKEIMKRHLYILSFPFFTNLGLQVTFWSYLTSIISKLSSLLEIWWIFNEYNSCLTESVLLVHKPITRLTFLIEVSSSFMIPLFLALSKISFFSNIIIESLSGGGKTKSTFVVVGLSPPTFTNKLTIELCQSNSTWSESCGSHIS